MKNKIKDNSDLFTTLASWTIVLTVVAIVFYISYEYINWTDKNLEYFVSYLKERPVKIPFWISAVVVFLTNVCTLFFNIICEIIKL